MIETRFKKTDIGEVPEDWDIKSLGEISANASYGVSAEAVPYDGYTKYIRITDIEDSTGLFIPSPLTSPAFYLDKFLVQQNDILIARTGASVGKSYLYNLLDGRIVFAGFLMKLNIYLANACYVFYQTRTERYKKWLQQESMRSGQPGINIEQLKSYVIPFPLQPEQQRIATALNNIDVLLSVLNKKIEKKKLIKQGVMQQFLTGKKRLNGFTEPWREKRLGELCQLFGRIGFRGYTKADLVRKGEGVITFSPSDIHDNQLDYTNCTYISMFKYEESPEIKVYNGDIIFCKTASIGKCAIVKDMNEKATINPQFVVMKNFDCSNVFLYYKLVERDFQERVKGITGGSTIPTMSQEKLKEQILLMPTLSEQIAIATVLSDMDAEIEALETKRSKYEQVKQGMMQQLLTGKIRLIG